MSEKKKRWRPSLTAYRELEKELEELKGCVDIDLANEVKRLKTELAEMESARMPMDAYYKIEEENNTLKRSNKYMEDETAILRKQVKEATDDYQKARREVMWLRNRGLWKRIINVTEYVE